MKEKVAGLEACVIGSGTGIPNPRRRPPALAVSVQRYLLLFDCGAHPQDPAIEHLALDASLERDFGLDSLARVELAARIERAFVSMASR